MKCLLLFMLVPLLRAGEGRFPKPEFESSYQVPVLATPLVQADAHGYQALAMLGLALGLMAYLVLVRRSHGLAWLLLISCLLYFGFYRHGCVCVVGSLQNVVLALSDAGYAVPLSMVGFFLLPLLFALFFGRVFCAGVCPLGAIQDVFIIRPLKVPAAAEHVLGMFPYLYLGLAVLYAATGTAFIICRLDPFVAFFRFDGSAFALGMGAVVLLAGTVIARPYCRYVCPYGVLLRWASFFSKYRLRITPDECIRCGLCGDACPFGAINRPFPGKVPESREVGKKRLGLLILAVPVLVVCFGFACSRLSGLLARVHPVVRLARIVSAEEQGARRAGSTLESEAFRASGEATAHLFGQARNIQQQFRTGAWWLGMFLGLVMGVKCISLSMRSSRREYEPDRMKCMSCGRCFAACPKERARRNPVNKDKTHG